MERRIIRRALAAAGFAMASAAVLSGCVASADEFREALGPAVDVAVEPEESLAPLPGDEPNDTATAPLSEAPYPEIAELASGAVWSFDVTGVEEFETDDEGQAPPAGERLVALVIDGELMQGEDAFFSTDFYIAAVDPETGQEYDTFTAIDFISPNDLVYARSSFTDAEALVVVPDGFVPSNWIIVAADTGEEWRFEVAL